MDHTGFNLLSLVLRLIIGKGTPRGLQELALAYFLTLIALMKRFGQVLEARIDIKSVGMPKSKRQAIANSDFKFGSSATGC
ncbi:MAG TPA: hypothetical protein VER98_18095 [Terriglobia bacterium]|nr:hypothetical protein [Terriglobia bacterium]